ncbi:hypothetical protein [Thermocoleostomius sinensis]|uniref:Uncharacterized protein n=1 Tax=Thermocoleostomius sinensis A174 TaxID=2016057 RepID=A0A9E9C8F9_9CYAN|nr:hypothetical protein [Thermocoleostomius sinensis]WAL58397.1 hypothetical protein OXH18_14525 [Thermocoleostomius sinensis A174]
MLTIPQSVAEALGIRTLGQPIAHYANGREERVGVVAGAIMIECLGRQTIDEALVGGR